MRWSALHVPATWVLMSFISTCIRHFQLHTAAVAQAVAPAVARKSSNRFYPCPGLSQIASSLPPQLLCQRQPDTRHPTPGTLVYVSISTTRSRSVELKHSLETT